MCVRVCVAQAIAGTVLKLVAGIFGSFAFRLVRADGTAQEGMDNILNRLVMEDMPTTTIYSSYLWSISTLLPGIPVLAIMVTTTFTTTTPTPTTHSATPGVTLYTVCLSSPRSLV